MKLETSQRGGDDGYKTNSGLLSRGGWFKSRIGAGAMWSQNHTKILRLR